MNFHKIEDDICIPKHSGSPLQGKKNVKFSYYLSNKLDKNLIDLEITTKLFDDEKIYIRKSFYKVRVGEMESCVKFNIIDHMKALGMDESDIPNFLSAENVESSKVNSANLRNFSS